MVERKIPVERERANGVTKVLIFGNGETRAWAPKQGSRKWRIKGRYPDGHEIGSSAVSEAGAIKRGLEIHAAVTSGSHRSLQSLAALLDFYEEKVIAPMEGTDRARYAEAQRTTLNILRFSRKENGQADAARPRTALLRIPCSRLDNVVLQPAISDVSPRRNRGGMDQLRRSMNHIFEFGRDQKFLDANQDPLRGLMWTAGKATQVRVGEAGGAAGTVRPDEVPDHRLVHDFAKALAERWDVWWYELQVLVGAYVGARFGEQAALRAGRIVRKDNPHGLLNDRGEPMTSRQRDEELEYHPQTIRIWAEIIESSTRAVSGTHEGQRMWEGAPKGAKRRWAFQLPETPCGVDLNDMMLRRLSELDGPDAWVFPTWVPSARHPWVSRSDWSKRVRDPANAVGWRFKYKDLRDTYATTLLNDLGLAPSDAIVFTGHVTAKTFFERYVGTRPVDVERRALAAFETRSSAWR